jgi:hypothetical protein
MGHHSRVRFFRQRLRCPSDESRLKQWWAMHTLSFLNRRGLAAGKFVEVVRLKAEGLFQRTAPIRKSVAPLENRVYGHEKRMDAFENPMYQLRVQGNRPKPSWRPHRAGSGEGGANGASDEAVGGSAIFQSLGQASGNLGRLVFDLFLKKDSRSECAVLSIVFCTSLYRLGASIFH